VTPATESAVAQSTSARLHVIRNATVEAIIDHLRFESARPLRVETTFSSYQPSTDAFGEVGNRDVARADAALLLLSLDPMREAFVNGRLDPDAAFAYVSALARGALDAGAKRVLLGTCLPPLGTGGRYRDAAALYMLNGRIAAFAEETSRIELLDVARFAAQLGDDVAIDKRFWSLFESPFSAALLRVVAQHTTAALAASSGASKKVLVLDADNTLWRGIVGEDGALAVAISATDPAGRPFHTFQRQVLALKESGVLLALASKNEPADVHAVFERSESVLRRSHFVAERIDWNDKAENIRSLAEELGLGLDSFVFIDDSDVECARVREALPMVDVLQVPRAVHDLPFLLGRYLGFPEGATAEDRRRSEDYVAARDRRTELGKHADLAAFVSSLAVVVSVFPVDGATTQRAAQLTQRTNQFNLTTKRYDVADIERAIADDDTLVLAADVSDRFGAQGVTGLAIVRKAGDRVIIDSFMLSCRVLGRSVELAFAAAVTAAVRERFGAVAILADHRPTMKNTQTRHFYEKCGFEQIDESAERVLFELAPTAVVRAPDSLMIHRRPT